MNRKRFSTAFERALKPRIAEELGLSSLGQSFHVDYLTSQRNLIELKLRKIRDDRKGESFTMSKNQYRKTNERFLSGQTMLDPRNGKCYHPTFSYLLLGYRSDKDISSIKTVDEIIEEMEISKGFLTDHKFIIEHDSSGQGSNFYRVPIDVLNKKAGDGGEVNLLDSTFHLRLVGNESYIPKLASMVFKH